jgi:hypothetical protein
MKCYDDYPPRPDLERVMRYKPASCMLFLQLWRNRRRGCSKLTVDRETTRDDYNMSQTVMRNRLMELQDVNVLHFDDAYSGFVVHFLIEHAE